MKVTNTSYCLEQGSAFAMEYADPVQIQATQNSESALIDQVISMALLELRVPEPNDYVNFKWKTEKKRDIECEEVAATRTLNALWAVASDRRTGDAK